jgi:hypothetical protein
MRPAQVLLYCRTAASIVPPPNDIRSKALSPASRERLL